MWACFRRLHHTGRSPGDPTIIRSGVSTAGRTILLLFLALCCPGLLLPVLAQGTPAGSDPPLLLLVGNPIAFLALWPVLVDVGPLGAGKGTNLRLGLWSSGEPRHRIIRRAGFDGALVRLQFRVRDESSFLL